MKKILKRKPFNLIEITLALAVMGLGIASIMSLFPVGLNAARDAVGDNYSADAADQFLHFIARAAQNNWTSYVGTTAGGGYITSTYPPSPATTNTGDNFGANLEGNIYATSYGNNVYGIRQGPESGPDFIGHIKVWKSQIQAQQYTGSWSTQTVDYEKAAALNIEISWPVEIPYQRRQKRYYYLEVYNPN